ncbi:HAD family hydrolase [Alteribacillus sp. HJP-4]|uniref:HAD family hydrolase n=1 Tax=Alteribacillus sp. HJP-4 TaxID=2775394 RepID=UPI0035CD271B
MNVKAVFLDMDGTLLTTGNEISNRNKEVIDQLREEGIHVFLATGRQCDIASPYHQQLELTTPLVCLNGAAVYDPFSYHPLWTKNVRIQTDLFYDLARTHFRNVIVHLADGIYCKQHDEMVETWVKECGKPPLAVEDFHSYRPPNVLKYSVRTDAIGSRHGRHFSNDCEVIYWEDGFELVPKDVSKWHTIRMLLRNYGIHPAEVISFGDGPNDVQMLQSSGIGVAMGNACDELKQVADAITLHHEQDGIAHFLENTVLSPSWHTTRAKVSSL